MVVNIRLAKLRAIETATDSMRRSWVGWDPSRSGLELWAQNRGRYAFSAARLEKERFATFSFREEILGVAAIHGWEWFEGTSPGVWKKALVGDVLGPGDAVHDALHGQTVSPGRAVVRLPRRCRVWHRRSARGACPEAVLSKAGNPTLGGASKSTTPRRIA